MATRIWYCLTGQKTKLFFEYWSEFNRSTNNNFAATPHQTNRFTQLQNTTSSIITKAFSIWEIVCTKSFMTSIKKLLSLSNTNIITRITYKYSSCYSLKERYISSSSCSAGSTDIPNPLSPLLPIVDRPRQVFRITSCILTLLLNVCSCWSSCFCTAMCGGP